jgi:FecCD transport family
VLAHHDNEVVWRAHEWRLIVTSVGRGPVDGRAGRGPHVRRSPGADGRPRELGFGPDRHRVDVCARPAFPPCPRRPDRGRLDQSRGTHLARSLVGGRYARVVPIAAALGAILVSAADTLVRTVIAPAQIPAGLVIALVGTPSFTLVLLADTT